MAFLPSPSPLHLPARPLVAAGPGRCAPPVLAMQARGPEGGGGREDHLVSTPPTKGPSAGIRGALPGRRSLILSSLAAAAGLLIGPPPLPSLAADTRPLGGTLIPVVPSSSPGTPFRLAEGLTEGKEATQVIQSLAKADAIFLGEHHNKKDDHALQAKFIRQIHTASQGKRGVEVGLEMVQLKFQPVLDAYVSGVIKDDEAAAKALFEGVEWDTRWQWPFEPYLPVFKACRELGVPLVALNVEDETLKKVSAGGLSKLTQEEKQTFIVDPQGFKGFPSRPGYSKYVNAVVMDSYAFHAQMGLLGDKPNPAHFLAARMLWDEGMSSIAYQRMKETGKTMVVLEGADHVKFRMGSVARLEKMDPSLVVKSILLNPTPSDTGGKVTEENVQSVELALQYDGTAAAPSGEYAIADYILFGNGGRV